MGGLEQELQGTTQAQITQLVESLFHDNGPIIEATLPGIGEILVRASLVDKEEVTLLGVTLLNGNGAYTMNQKSLRPVVALAVEKQTRRFLHAILLPDELLSRTFEGENRWIDRAQEAVILLKERILNPDGDIAA